MCRVCGYGCGSVPAFQNGQALLTNKHTYVHILCRNALTHTHTHTHSHFHTQVRVPLAVGAPTSLLRALSLI